MNRALAVAALTVLLPAGVSAQLPLNTGVRVRVTRTNGNTVVGRFESATAEEVKLSNEATRAEYLIPQSAIRRIERSVARTRRFGRNFAIAAGTVSALGGIVGAATYTPCESTGFMSCFMSPDNRLQAFGMGLAAGAMVGVPIGLIFGLTARHDQWEVVSARQDSEPQFRIAPAGAGGVVLGLSMVVGGHRGSR